MSSINIIYVIFSEKEGRFMRYTEVLETVKNVTGENLTQKELARILRRLFCFESLQFFTLSMTFGRCVKLKNRLR